MTVEVKRALGYLLIGVLCAAGAALVYAIGRANTEPNVFGVEETPALVGIIGSLLGLVALAAVAMGVAGLLRFLFRDDG